MKGKEYPDTFAELEKMFKSDSDCYDYLKKQRWPDGFVCPKCGSRVMAGARDSRAPFRQATTSVCRPGGGGFVNTQSLGQFVMPDNAIGLYAGAIEPLACECA